MLAQMKVVDDDVSVSAVNQDQQQKAATLAEGRGLRECWNCGRKHEHYK